MMLWMTNDDPNDAVYMLWSRKPKLTGDGWEDAEKHRAGCVYRENIGGESLPYRGITRVSFIFPAPPPQESETP